MFTNPVQETAHHMTEEKISCKSEELTFQHTLLFKGHVMLPYDQLEDRLNSFLVFPRWEGPVDVKLMAEAGFIYTGQEDLVYCFSCKIKLDGWAKHMDPLLRHKKESPTCSFVRQLQVIKEMKTAKSVVAPSKPLNPWQTASIRLQSQVSTFATSKPIHTVVTGLDEPRLYPGRGGDEWIFHRSPITVENYGSELNRLKSFIGWPLNESVHPEQLARVGFVYTGEGSLVQCFQCGVRYRNWLKGDVPLSVHQKCNPRCAFLHTLTSKSKILADKEGPYTSFIQPHTIPNTEKENFALEFPDYTNQATRLQSFKYWGGALPKEELAEAGFYMIARQDVVRCFSCHVVLQDWEKTDNVIEEHRKLSPDCPFLKATPEEKYRSASKIGAYNFQELLMPQLSTRRQGLTSNLRVDVIKENFASSHKTILPPDFMSSSDETRTSEIMRFQLNSSMLWTPSEDFKNTNVETSAGSVGNLCRVCYSNKIECIFLPCGHARTCQVCATRIVNSSQPCPYCKKSVSTTHQVFL